MIHRSKPYKLPPSLKQNEEFALFSKILDKTYKRGVQTILSVGKRNPNEEDVIKLTETLFNKAFIKTRPPWLVNDETNGRMELDGYCKELKIAIEYQSGQGHISDENVRYRDKLKKRLCIEHNVHLLEIWPEKHIWTILLRLFIEMRGKKIVPRKSVLWYGCWINRNANTIIYSHSMLTRESNIHRMKTTTIQASRKLLRELTNSR